MKEQYCITALTDNYVADDLQKKLIEQVEKLQEIHYLDAVLKGNEYRVQLKIETDSPFALLQSKLQDISHSLQVDIVLQQWQRREVQPGLLIMDMDSTLVQAETIDEIARIAGVGDKVAEITESAMRGELDFTESLIARVGMLTGISVESIGAVHDCLPLTGGAKDLLKKARTNGCHTALVSGGFTLFAGPVAEKVGFDTLSANTLEVIDDKLTGKVTGNVVDGMSKLATLNQLKQQLGLSTEQIVAIGDGANDLPMLSAAGTGIAFHAKPKVQQQAKTILNYNDLNAVCWFLNW